jgi:hypothetical protein
MRMTDITRITLFTETGGLERRETSIYVEDIGEFIRWWISSPPSDMKVEVPGEFPDVDLHPQAGESYAGVSAT